MAASFAWHKKGAGHGGFKQGRCATDRWLWRELQSALAEVPGDRMEEPGVVGPWSTKDLRQELCDVHGETVRFVSALSDELLGREEVERRIRIDTFAHYREHAQQIRCWLAPEPQP